MCPHIIVLSGQLVDDLLSLLQIVEQLFLVEHLEVIAEVISLNRYHLHLVISGTADGSFICLSCSFGTCIVCNLHFECLLRVVVWVVAGNWTS